MSAITTEFPPTDTLGTMDPAAYVYLVTQASLDPAFRDLLVADPELACRQADVDLPAGSILRVLLDTPLRRHVVGEVMLAYVRDRLDVDSGIKLVEVERRAGEELLIVPCSLTDPGCTEEDIDAGDVKAGWFYVQMWVLAITYV